MQPVPAAEQRVTGVPHAVIIKREKARNEGDGDEDDEHGLFSSKEYVTPLDHHHHCHREQTNTEYFLVRNM